MPKYLSTPSAPVPDSGPLSIVTVSASAADAVKRRAAKAAASFIGGLPAALNGSGAIFRHDIKAVQHPARARERHHVAIGLPDGNAGGIGLRFERRHQRQTAQHD